MSAGRLVTRPFRYLASLYNPVNWRGKRWLWFLQPLLVAYLLAVAGLWYYWSQEPGFFDVRALAQPLAGGQDQPAPGHVTTATALEIANTLLHKPGGYLSNDMLPPGVIMDNMPSWEFGALTELREIARALRNDFSRAQTQSVEDKDLMIADSQFHFDHAHWILPATEWEYQKGVEALQRYLQRLSGPTGQGAFFARADNLNSYLAVVEKRLGSYAQRLSANVRELRYVAPTAAGESLAAVAVPDSEVTANTPWLEIDNVFYEARGYVWALWHVLKAIEIDFGAVLDGKNARPAVQRIIHKLRHTQHTVWSPVIMNNSGFGMLTNHSLILASYISRANAAIIDLRILLMQG